MERMETTFYEILALEGFMGLQGGKNLSEASYRHLLDFFFHSSSKRLRLRLALKNDVI
jgi:hypothetical protein